MSISVVSLALSSGFGGANRDRTGDLKLAKLALSQLSYGPGFSGIYSLPSASLVGPGRVERPTSRLSGVRSNHLSYEPETVSICAFQGHFAKDITRTRSRHRARSHGASPDLDGRKGNEDGGQERH